MDPVLGSLREDIAELEVDARELDPGPEELAALWAAAGAHVLDSAHALGTAPSYSPPSRRRP